MFVSMWFFPMNPRFARFARDLSGRGTESTQNLKRFCFFVIRSIFFASFFSIIFRKLWYSGQQA